MTANKQPIVERLVLGSLETNCYLVADKATSSCVVIDPADSGQTIFDFVKNRGWTVVSILLTHAHYDHIGGVNILKELTGAKVCIHRKDEEMLITPEKNFSVFIGDPYAGPNPDILLDETTPVRVGGLHLKVLHTPGHTPGSISLAADGIVIVGDTLFLGSIGRTDFPGSSTQDLIRSIKDKLLTLPSDTKVYPGHGPETTIGGEQTGNPFLV